jgi:hypothetical protein
MKEACSLLPKNIFTKTVKKLATAWRGHLPQKAPSLPFAVKTGQQWVLIRVYIYLHLILAYKGQLLNEIIDRAQRGNCVKDVFMSKKSAKMRVKCFMYVGMQYL